MDNICTRLPLYTLALIEFWKSQSIVLVVGKNSSP
jgi:hypothetical protein